MMRTVYLLRIVATVGCLIAASQPSLGGLVLSTETVSTVAGTKGFVTLKVMSDDPHAVLGWQTNLLIQRESGAVGEVSFLGGNQPAETVYLLGDQGEGALNAQFGTENYNMDRLKVYDQDTQFPIIGGQIGQSNSDQEKDLALLQLSASSNALGEFGLYVLNRPGLRSVWTTFSGADLVERQFEGVLDSPTPVRIGTVKVTAVPEVSAFALLLLVTGVTVLWRIGPFVCGYWFAVRLHDLAGERQRPRRTLIPERFSTAVTAPGSNPR